MACCGFLAYEVELEDESVRFPQLFRNAILIMVISASYSAIGWANLLFSILGYAGTFFGVFGASLILGQMSKGVVPKTSLAPLVYSKVSFTLAIIFYLGQMGCGAFWVYYISGGYEQIDLTNVIEDPESAPGYIIPLSIISTIICAVSILTIGLSLLQLSHQLRNLRIQGVIITVCCW